MTFGYIVDWIQDVLVQIVGVKTYWLGIVLVVAALFGYEITQRICPKLK